MNRRELLRLVAGLALAPGAARLLYAQDAAAGWPAIRASGARVE